MHTFLVQTPYVPVCHQYAQQVIYKAYMSNIKPHVAMTTPTGSSNLHTACWGGSIDRPPQKNKLIDVAVSYCDRFRF